MFRRLREMRPLLCCAIYKDDSDFDRVSEEINEDYHNGDCEYITELETLKDLPFINRYFVADLKDVVVVISPVSR